MQMQNQQGGAEHALRMRRGENEMELHPLQKRALEEEAFSRSQINRERTEDRPYVLQQRTNAMAAQEEDRRNAAQDRLYAQSRRPMMEERETLEMQGLREQNSPQMVAIRRKIAELAASGPEKENIFRTIQGAMMSGDTKMSAYLLKRLGLLGDDYADSDKSPEEVQQRNESVRIFNENLKNLKR